MGYGCTSAHTFQLQEKFVIEPGIIMKLATAEGKYKKFKRDLLSSSHFNRLLHTFSFSYYYKKVERGMPVNLPINYYLFPTTTPLLVTFFCVVKGLIVSLQTLRAH